MLTELERLSGDADYFIIDGIWKFRRDEAMPAIEIEDGESGYSYCIWGGKARCFFYPMNS